MEESRLLQELGSHPLGSFCGAGSEAQFVTTKTRHLYLKFKLDSDVEDGYFFIRIDAITDVYGRPVVSKPLDSQSDDVDDQSGGGKVVGGKEVKKGSHPWQVDLNFVNIISTQCLGLLS
ncbi:hypothetical protein IscW_ISCW001979 [Ixodes scapularis]|uniref:Uncharacterized protein n=1 Tax=Ixodes scapularis TaxID=6945 RepID=B7PCD4_IXOSC|nr:hypothetical protein IscW_ISCW001979 [Ixodes scapularis]|eukprot:XP_002409675.1 hypothetical protein IscW_ISCW001979 [Ixodes scapularis]